MPSASEQTPGKRESVVPRMSVAMDAQMEQLCRRYDTNGDGIRQEGEKYWEGGVEQMEKEVPGST